METSWYEDNKKAQQSWKSYVTDYTRCSNKEECVAEDRHLCRLGMARKDRDAATRRKVWQKIGIFVVWEWVERILAVQIIMEITFIHI